MNILVCFKITPDLETLSPEDWTVDSELQIDLSFTPQELDVSDESALCLGLRLAQKMRQDAENIKITAVTVGRRNPGRFIKTLYALGYDECIFIPMNSDCRFSPENTADILADAAVKTEADIILTGERSSPGGSSFTAAILAERLGRACYGGVSALDWKDKMLIAESVSGDSIITRMLPPFAVISVGNAPFTRLRIPTLKDKMSVAHREAEIMPEAVPHAADSRLIALKSADVPRACKLIKTDSAHEAAEIILNYMLEQEGI